MTKSFDSPHLVCEFDEAVDLSEGQRRKALVEFGDGLAEVEAIDDGVGQDAGASDDGLSGDFSRDTFD